MLKEHLLEHVNTYVIVQCLAFIIGSAIYGWHNAYLIYGVKKDIVTVMQKVRNSANYIGKMIFIFALSAGISWAINYLT